MIFPRKIRFFRLKVTCCSVVHCKCNVDLSNPLHLASNKEIFKLSFSSDTDNKAITMDIYTINKPFPSTNFRYLNHSSDITSFVEVKKNVFD